MKYPLIFMQSIGKREVPRYWKIANVVAIHKKGSKTEIANYRLVSLTSVSCKTLYDPYMINQVESIEKVQRKAVRFATNFKERESDCTTAKLKEINLPSLEERRDRVRLALFRDIVKL